MLLRNLLKDERIFYLAVSFVFITDKHKRGKNLCSLFYTETYKRRCIETNASVRYSGKTMRLLYDLTATQPSPESKFHGGGAYGGNRNGENLPRRKAHGGGGSNRAPG